MSQVRDEPFSVNSSMVAIARTIPRLCTKPERKLRGF
jgi:hypothetical protein